MRTRCHSHRFPAILLFFLALAGVHQFFAVTCPNDSMPKTYCTACHDTVPATLVHTVYCHSKRLFFDTIKFTDLLVRSKYEDTSEEEKEFTEELYRDYNIRPQ